MKYSSHGRLSVDQWRQLISFNDVNMKKPIEKAVQATVKDAMKRKESKLIPSIAGFAAVAGVYAIVPALVVADGPLPFGDAIAVGLLAIPDYAIYAFGYSLFD